MELPSGRKLYLGPRLRVLRRELGLNQTQMAEELGISPSYLNHLERNQRPLTAQMLLRLANTYDLDLREFVAGSADASVRDLQDVLADPLVRDMGVPRHEIAEVAENYPGVADAVARIYRALGDLRRMPDRVEQLGQTNVDAPPPVEWLRRVLEQNRKHFPALDQAAVDRSATFSDQPELLCAEITERLGNEFGVAVRILPQKVLPSTLRYYDFHRKRLMLSEALPFSSRLFALAFQFAGDSFAEQIDSGCEACAPPDQESRSLLKIALTSYAAAALVMPYGRFWGASEESGFDPEFLEGRFGMGFEQVAHRITTLDRQGPRGVPFFLLKLDSAGNVVKRLQVDGAPIPRFGGGCPRWGLHRALDVPGESLLRRIEADSGQRFVAMARGVARTPTKAPSVIVIGCHERHSARLAWSDVAGDVTPIGASCNVCVQPDCRERSMPPVTRALDLRSYVRTTAPYPFRLT